MGDADRCATPAGTRAYADRMTSGAGLAPHSYRSVDGLVVSTVGLGTYLGDADAETDMLYTEAVVEAVRLGCNLVDSAINYRFQRSERSVGAALERIFATKTAARSEVVVATKGGYVPFDGAPPAGAAGLREYLRRTFFEPGVCRPEEMTTSLQHCMAPGYLEHQLERSRENLGLDCVDVYYIHNPEGQLPEVGPAEFERRLRAAFEMLERKAADGAIGRYGVATWNGFRRETRSADFLSLERLVSVALDVGGEGHRFRVVQLPYNLAMTEAFSSFNQTVAGEALTLLEAAERLGVAVVASASLLQAQLTDGLPEEVEAAFDLPTDAQRAIQFVRSTPGVATALVGMSRTAHVRSNLQLLGAPPAPAGAVLALFADE